MKKILRNILRVILIVITVIALFVIISLVRHKVCSSREKDLLTPLGELVEVNGHKMSVYTEASSPLWWGFLFIQKCTIVTKQKKEK